MKLIDLAGSQFGKWTVLYLDKAATHTSAAYWMCECSCGTKKSVCGTSLRTRRSKSCGFGKCRGQRLHGKKYNSAQRHVLYGYKSSAKKRDISWRLSDEAFFHLTQQKCRYCGTPPMTTRKADGQVYLYNGVDRVVNEIGYTEENSATCCKICNSAKNIWSEYQFLNWVERVYFHSQLKRQMDAFGMKANA